VVTKDGDAIALPGFKVSKADLETISAELRIISADFGMIPAEIQRIPPRGWQLVPAGAFFSQAVDRRRPDPELRPLCLRRPNGR
jgi:hypothetical protein